MDLLDLARARLGELRHRLFAAEHRVALSFTTEPHKGQVRVTGAGPTIEAAIDAAAAKLGDARAIGAWCHDCTRPYGDEHGFPDLVVPHDVWRRISPTGNEGGLLCPSCMAKRVHDAGITCSAIFTSGPFCTEDR